MERAGVSKEGEEVLEDLGDQAQLGGAGRRHQHREAEQVAAEDVS